MEVQTVRSREYHCCKTRGLQHCYYDSCTTRWLQYYYNNNCCPITQGSAGCSIIIITFAQHGGCCTILITTAQHGVHNMVSYVTKQDELQDSREGTLPSAAQRGASRHRPPTLGLLLLQECLDGTQMSGNIRAAREVVVAH